MTERVLVTGAAGLIGRAVVAELRRRGRTVIGFVLPADDAPEADSVVRGDVTRMTDVARAVREATTVVHLAAIPHPSLADPHEVFRVNVDGTYTVLAAAADAGIPRVVLASSINASGIPFNTHGAMPAYFPIDEALPPDITDAYSLSKRINEESASMAWRGWGISSVALRFPFVGGGARLLDVVAHARADPGSLVREGWSYLDDRDAARAVVAAIDADTPGASVVGLSARDTLLDVPTADALQRWAPHVPLRAAPIGRGSLINTDRAHELLGFAPRHTVDSVLAETEAAARVV